MLLGGWPVVDGENRSELLSVRIGMANGCVCRPLGIGLMILLNGISGLGIFGRLRLPRMPGTL